MISWYWCSGCGPSVRCKLCGNTWCSQGLDDNCPGCRKAREAANGPIPRKMRYERGRRPNKHLRGLLRRGHRHSRLFRRTQPRVSFKDLLGDEWG